MKKLIIIALLFCACKSDKKENKVDNQIQKEEVKKWEKVYEKSLIDLRDVNQDFGSDYSVQRFGIDKKNDSTLFFVLKLDNQTLPETVQKYSLGAKAYNSQSEEKVLTRSYSPDLKKIGNDKYLMLKILPTDWKYMDSIDFYIYARKDWKASGRLGGIKIRDILIEE